MSETVGYKGKLKLCKKYKDANELQANLQKFWQSIPREKRNKFYQDVEEFDVYDNFVEVNQVQDGVYKFITQFYNGSTDLQEMLQEGFDQTSKEDYE